MKRWKVWASFTIGSVFGIGLVATCGGGGSGSRGGDGFLTGDGALDIAAADAAPGPAMMGNCDQIHVHTAKDASGNTTTTTYYYSDFDVPGLDATIAPVVSAVVCNPMCFGSSCQPSPCPQGSTCNDSGAPDPNFPADPCVQRVASFNGSKVRVSCGYHLQFNFPMSPMSNSDTGSTYQQVYLRVG